MLVVLSSCWLLISVMCVCLPCCALLSLQRIKMCADKGFVALDPDNMDGG